MSLFSGTIATLEAALSYSALKQKVIAQNIANADTPNYKAKDVRFQTAFQNSVNTIIEAKRTDYRHLPFSNRPPAPGIVTTKRHLSYHHNGNSVDVDKEMADLATNQIYYYSVADLLGGKFQSLHSAIRGGK